MSSALARLTQHPEGGVRGLFDDFEESGCRAARRALALFPVAYRLDRNADPRREGGLGEPGPCTHITGIACLAGTRRIVRGRSNGTRIAGDRPFATVGKDLNQAPVRFQPHAQHRYCSCTLSACDHTSFVMDSTSYSFIGVL